MPRSDDPNADFDRWDAEQCRLLEDLPECSYCGEPITEDYYNINGDDICKECLDANFMKVL